MDSNDDDDWVSEGVAKVILRRELGVSEAEAYELFLEASQSLWTLKPEVCYSKPDLDLSLYPAGSSALDEYDPLLCTRYSRQSLEAWIKQTFGKPPATAQGRSGRPGKREAARAAYLAIYSEVGAHEACGDCWEEVCRKVTSRTGQSLSVLTMRRALGLSK